MTTLIASVIANWRILVLASLMGLLTVQSMRLDSTQKDVAILEAKIREAQIVTEAYTRESEKNLDTLRTSIPLMVESAEKNAVRNYKARYKVSNVACVTGTTGVLPSNSQAGTNVAISPTPNDATPSEFVVACATDAGTVKLWQEWATLNKIPIK